MKPGETGVKMVPINRMVPRSFVTNVKPDQAAPVGKPMPVRGIAFGGDSGVARVDLSSDAGKTWQAATLGKDEGKYGFRQWKAEVKLPIRGKQTLMVRCTNSNGVAQPDRANWNPSGFMRNVIETTAIVVT